MQLVDDIDALPAEKMSKVLAIIKSRIDPRVYGGGGANLDEIEINIEELDTATLRALQDFVNDVLGRTRSGMRSRRLILSLRW